MKDRFSCRIELVEHIAPPDRAAVFAQNLEPFDGHVLRVPGGRVYVDLVVPARRGRRSRPRCTQLRNSPGADAARLTLEVRLVAILGGSTVLTGRPLAHLWSDFAERRWCSVNIATTDGVATAVTCACVGRKNCGNQ